MLQTVRLTKSSGPVEVLRGGDLLVEATAVYPGQLPPQRAGRIQVIKDFKEISASNGTHYH